MTKVKCFYSVLIAILEGDTFSTTVTLSLCLARRNRRDVNSVLAVVPVQPAYKCQ
jgi:hypothetical protein